MTATLPPLNPPHITESNYEQFVAELTRLTRKYGIAIQSVGGVYIADHPDEFSTVSYDADITSGDIYPIGFHS